MVARSLETALHKLHELKFDLNQVVSGFGSAPLPPVAEDELGAIGRTNDAILYGGRVVLWVQADDDQLAEIGPKVPSSRVAGPRRAVRAHLRALRPRLLQDRSDAVQPGGGRLLQSEDGPQLRLRPDQAGGACISRFSRRS